MVSTMLGCRVRAVLRERRPGPSGRSMPCNTPPGSPVTSSQLTSSQLTSNQLTSNQLTSNQLTTEHRPATGCPITHAPPITWGYPLCAPWGQGSKGPTWGYPLCTPWVGGRPGGICCALRDGGGAGGPTWGYSLCSLWRRRGAGVAYLGVSADVVHVQPHQVSESVRHERRRQPGGHHRVDVAPHQPAPAQLPQQRALRQQVHVDPRHTCRADPTEQVHVDPRHTCRADQTEQVHVHTRRGPCRGRGSYLANSVWLELGTPFGWGFRVCHGCGSYLANSVWLELGTPFGWGFRVCRGRGRTWLTQSRWSWGLLSDGVLGSVEDEDRTWLTGGQHGPVGPQHCLVDETLVSRELPVRRERTRDVRAVAVVLAAHVEQAAEIGQVGEVESTGSTDRTDVIARSVCVLIDLQLISACSDRSTIDQCVFW